MPRALAVTLILAALCALVFGQVAGYGFIDYDDPDYVRDNPHVARGLDAGTFTWAFTTFRLANWHPVTWLSHALDVSIFGLRPGAHHLVSVLIHAANALLLYLFLLRTTGRSGPALFVAAVFAVHPLRVESVAWIAERKDVLSTLFWFLALLAYARHSARPDRLRLALVVALFALGLMTKPMLVTLPFVLLLLDGWPLGRLEPGAWRWTIAWPLVREKAPFFALAAASAVVTLAAQSAGGAIRTTVQVPLADRAANAALSAVAYLGKAVWPAGLGLFYPLRPGGVSWGAAAAAALALAAVTVAAVRQARRRPYLLVGWSWYLVTLVPVIGLVQVGEQSMADRYTYVPLVGPVVALTWLVADAVADRPRARRFATALAIVAVAVLAIVAARQVSYWRSTESIFSRTIAVTGDNWFAEHVLGTVAARAGRLDEAVARQERALALRPRDAKVLNNLGQALIASGRAGEGIERLREALEVQPAFPLALANLGAALAQGGDLAGAEAAFRRALAIDAADAMAHFNLGMALKLTGRRDEAVVHFREAARLDPADRDARAQLDDLER